MRKTLFLLFIVIVILQINVHAQERFELKTLAQDVKIQVRDSFAIIETDGLKDTFLVQRKANERYYSFVNEEDKTRLSNILKIDKGEIKDLWTVAFPNIDAIDQIINRAASIPTGLLLAQKEAGGVPVGTNEELGGQRIIHSDDDSMFFNMYTLLALIIGAIVGYLLNKTLGKKSQTIHNANPTIPVTEEERNFDEMVEMMKGDAEKVTQAAKAKIKKITADKKEIANELKSLKDQNKQTSLQLQQLQQFHQQYFTNLMKEIVNPLNQSIEKGDRSKAMEYLLKLAAHTSSLSRHELGMKQAYDTINIANLMKQTLPPNLKIETITAETPIDRIPDNIRNIQQLMQLANVNSLGQTVISGYKIDCI